MKNILVITTGTRDVQLNINSFDENILGWNEGYTEVYLKTDSINKIRTNKNPDFPDSLVITQPRQDGQTIQMNLDWESFLCYPIIDNAIEFLLEQKKTLHHILIVVTNQELEIVQSKMDTLFFGDLIKNYLLKKFSGTQIVPLLKTLQIKKDVTNPDALYPFMEKSAPELFGPPKQDIDKVYLLAQGGVDQINQTLTLQLIRYFQHKVVQLQKAEGKAIKELNFPRLFLNDLTREKLVKHIKDFNFELIVPSISDNEEILNLAKFSERRLELDYDSKYQTEYIRKEWLPIESTDGKLKDLYLSAKINFYRKVYSVYLWKLFTLSENMLLPFINEFFKIDVESIYNKKYKNASENAEWTLVLKRIPGLYEKLSKDGVFLNNPNRIAFAKILCFLKRKKHLTEDTVARFDSVQKISSMLNILNDKRNDIAHYLRPLRPADIEQVFSNGQRIEDLNGALDAYFELDSSSDFGVFSDIQKRLLEIA